MVKEGKLFKHFKGKKGFEIVPQTIVVLIVVLFLIGLVAYIIYSKIISKMVPIQ